MRTGKKIKEILANNTVLLSLNDKQGIDIVIMSTADNTAHMVSGSCLSNAVGAAYADIKKIERNKNKPHTKNIAA